MRFLRIAHLIVVILLLGPALAAEKLTLGSDHVVIDGKDVFVNGKKVSCAELAGTIHENWGGVFFDERCVKRTIRIVPYSVRPPKDATADQPAGADADKFYYSPVNMPALAKSRSVVISNHDDHTEISYRIRCDGANCISKVMELRWEDGSEFQVFEGGRRIFRLKEAGPYWGYRQENGISLFFVDAPPPYPGMGKDGYNGLIYNYILVNRTGMATHQYKCTFNFARLEGYISARFRNRPVAPEKSNPFPLIISRFLSERGANRKLDRCEVQNIPN